MDGAEPKRNPWFWIPTLYVAQGLPYALVMSVSVVLYKNLGVSNAANRVLDELARVAVDHQAVVEPAGGPPENAAAMDLGRRNFSSARCSRRPRWPSPRRIFSN